MFVSKESAEMGKGQKTRVTQDRAEKSGVVLLGELENVHITSHTGLTERRGLIKSWTPEELVRAHTALRTKIILQGDISHADKILLEPMEREGIEEGGKHVEAIQILGTQRITHGQGLTITDSRGETFAGFTKVAVWEVIASEKQ